MSSAPLASAAYRVYGRRWPVLGAFCLVNLAIQTLWIAYSPITRAAASFYGVSELRIGLLAMVFMAAYLPLSIPASWLIDRAGWVLAAGLGSVLAAAGGLLRGLAGGSYGLALGASLLVAAAQPLLLNAWTKMPAAWFPAAERATALGLLTLANIAGTALGLLLSPLLLEGLGIPGLQLLYGGAMAAAALLFLALARERPPLPPDESASLERALVLEGLRGALAKPSFRAYLLLAFLGMGVFNGVTTWIEGIAASRGLGSARAGSLGALMLAGGVLGALLLPALSDRLGRRRPFLVLALAGAAPGLLGLGLARGFPLLAASSLLLGFFLVSASPIGMQYAAEEARPAPEGASNGLVTLAGQVSVVLVWAMEGLARAAASFGPVLLGLAGLLLLGALLASRLEE